MDALYLNSLQLTNAQLTEQNERLRYVLAACVQQLAGRKDGTLSYGMGKHLLATDMPTVTRNAVAASLTAVEKMVRDFEQQGLGPREMAAEVRRQVAALQEPCAPARPPLSQQDLMVVLGASGFEGKPVSVDEATGRVELADGQAWDPLNVDSDAFRLMARMVRLHPRFMDIVRAHSVTHSLACRAGELREAIVRATVALRNPDAVAERICFERHLDEPR